MWVDHERPASGIRDDDAVVDAEVVDRQASDLPRSDEHRIAERCVERERRRARDLLVDAQPVPLDDTVLYITPAASATSITVIIIIVVITVNINVIITQNKQVAQLSQRSCACFVSVNSFNSTSTIREAQVPLQIHGCVQLNYVLFSSPRRRRPRWL